MKLSQTQRIALDTVRNHEVTYGKNWRSTTNRIFVDGRYQNLTFPFTYRTLVTLQERGLVELIDGRATVAK